jgi:hypothetical protein
MFASIDCEQLCLLGPQLTDNPVIDDDGVRGGCESTTP